jgi:hypothetical protein
VCTTQQHTTLCGTYHTLWYMLYTKRVTLVFLFQFVCTLAFIIYCLLIVINFAEMFHTNLTRIHNKRETDSWLTARCNEQEFIHHMRHHIDLCEKVAEDARTNAYLVAVQLALDGLHLCGSYSCEKILIAITMSFQLSIYTWIASIIIILIMLPLCVLPLYRKWQRNLLLHENHLGVNAPVPSIYIRDQVGSMHDIPFRALSQPHPSHFMTEPRQRRLLDNSIDADNQIFNANNDQYQRPYHNHSQ